MANEIKNYFTHTLHDSIYYPHTGHYCYPISLQHVHCYIEAINFVMYWVGMEVVVVV